MKAYCTGLKKFLREICSSLILIILFSNGNNNNISNKSRIYKKNSERMRKHACAENRGECSIRSI